LFVFLNNCSDDRFESSLNYVSFGDANYSTGVDPGGSTTIDLYVYTTKIMNSDTTFNIVVDPSSDAAPGSYDVPGSVMVPSGTNEGKFTVGLSDVNLGIGINKLVIGFTDVQGFAYGEATTLSYIQNCTEVTAVLDFSFDYYSSETGWYVTDALDGVVASGGGYSDGQWSASENITLCSGRDYTLFVTDVYGDGMFDGTNLGSYTLTIGGVVKVSEDGDFEDSKSTAFDTN